MANEHESFIERETKVLRDGSLIAGLGAAAVGEIIESPKVLLLGVVTLAGSAAFEGLRRLVRRDNQEH